MQAPSRRCSPPPTGSGVFRSPAAKPRARRTLPRHDFALVSSSAAGATHHERLQLSISILISRRLPRVFSSHLRGQFSDLRQIPLHFAPSVPQRVIRARVKRPLECPHAVFQELHQQFLIRRRRRIMNCQQIRRRPKTHPWM
jgi:hypothetical protein